MKKLEQSQIKIDLTEKELENGVIVKKRKQNVEIKTNLKKIDQREEDERGVILKKRKQVVEKTAILKKIDQGGKEEQKNWMERAEKHEEGRICNNLPDELTFENILTRLPATTLARFSCVSKLWYSSILNNSRFSVIHYNQNKNQLFLVFNMFNVLRGGIESVYFFSVLQGEMTDIRCLSALDVNQIHELVGFCNGLACMKLVNAPNDTSDSVTIVNPIRCESLVLTFIPPTGGYIYLCHGFGFDSLSQVYKTVIIFASKANKEFLCMVITMGTISWRKIITSIFDISPPPGSSPFLSRMVTRVPRLVWRQATFCGGDLFWRTRKKVGNTNDRIEMLLSFNLHNEKIRVIRLPTECTLGTEMHQGQYLVVDHLMEFKGYPCIARCERITRSSNDHCGHRCDYQTGVCCCCYKVHMYVLKDKDKQVWSRETFGVQITDQEGLLPPLCWYFDSTSAATPPTRILAFCDQVLLYWFNGDYLIFFDLQKKHLKVVGCSHTYPSIFQTKMNDDPKRRIADDDNIYCPSMDYQLHAQVENIISLKTFIPKGAKTSKFDSVDEFMHIVNNNLAAGWLITGRSTHGLFAFS